MKNFDRTPHNFLIYLRNRTPWGARLIDGARSLSFVSGVLSVKIDTGSWPGSELAGRVGEMEAEAKRFFGPDASFQVEVGTADPEYLPFPVNASKYWNHVAFLSVEENGGGNLLAVRKPFYALKMMKGEMEEGDWAETFRFSWRGGASDRGVDGLAAALPDLLDELCAFARSSFSYAHLLMPFPGHEAADWLEARFHAIRDWGTPATPPAVLQKYVGRIHYANPLSPPTGIKMSQELNKP